MKRQIIILILFCYSLLGSAQQVVEPDFSWGNCYYYNLNIGDSVKFKDVVVVLLDIKNHYNQLSIDNDTIDIKVSRRSLPLSFNSVRVFVADNRNVKKLAANKAAHGLLKKDALICLSESKEEMMPFDLFSFPVSYNHGFNWDMNEDNHMFSYQNKGCSNSNNEARSHEGIEIALTDARGIQKHWLVAIENSTVVWVEDEKKGRKSKEACLLLQSNSNTSIFYVYDHLFANSVEVKEGMQVRPGELLGTIWGDENWGHLQLAVVKSDTIPSYKNRFTNCVNFFPELYELYFKNSFSFTKSFTRGKVDFARPPVINGNRKNLLAFEEYAGMGWQLGTWNTADKVMSCTKEEIGNARLKKVLFENSPAECRNPENYFEFEINVRNGVYRIRSQVGDVKLASWQKIEYEGVEAATYNLNAGELKWTSEKVVKVNDRKLTIRIYVDPANQKVAGISEIVFQQAY
ncbi:hypothetical protein [Draconibacterium halophilum]|uniref:Peptidase M23 domain-containing protein n=1 Tax=Draconibacterium halophilum TaxID=2706887 RepID=A0A6C0REV3_9BACT|nr:hypothetical protein [Draconibacterium halophilum]QIA08392.1 hypothetical protein G0Q07_12010 [Draconibacterium halophilum]